MTQQPDAVDRIGQVDVRYAPQATLRGGSGISAADLAELGAVAGGIGLEVDAVVALVNRVAATSARATLEDLPELLKLVKNANDARINRLIQAVRSLPEAPIQQQPGVWATLSGRGQQQAGSYVSRNEVLVLLGQALVENLRT